MVAANPLFRGRWTWKKFGATVIDDIWPEVTFFTCMAAVVTLVSKKTSVNLGVSNQLLTVLGLVLGLVISFRTSSAYERYQDGRKMWSNIIVASKNLAQMIWIHVPVERKDVEGEEPWTKMDVIIEKKSMVNLVQAYSVSVKHLLRAEPGVYYEDLYPLLSFLPHYANDSETGHRQDTAERLPLWYIRDEYNNLHDPAAPSSFLRNIQHERDHTLVEEPKSMDTDSKGKPNRYVPARSDTFDPEAALPSVESDQPLKPARSPPEWTIFDYFPILRLFRWLYRVAFDRQKLKENRRRKRKAYDHIVESHVPLEISLVLSNYSAFLMKNGFVQAPIATAITNSLILLQDTVCNLERICNTPLPFAYQAHLRMSLWLYLLLLPFQIYTFFGYITIPGTAFASFLLLGFLEIGQEIENPFNYDYNDLDLDGFCLSLQRDLQEITTFTSPLPRKFLYSKYNQPFAPADRRTAVELRKLGDKYQQGTTAGINSINRTLVSSWKTVDRMTRER
ncbi:Bestrophin, RFP-TM, chloride channel-domain-containing protein [Panaeolus papilionaceus]|nr:Bestrophin, RFP-TM, chloride channel-domain-containing protein [Panaeolus papilionaceus]